MSAVKYLKDHFAIVTWLKGTITDEKVQLNELNYP